MPTVTHLPYAGTHAFSGLVIDYLSGSDHLRPFYRYTPDAAGMAAALASRAQHKVDRAALVQVLEEQYRELPPMAAVAENIRLLGEETTFTVCTAHQPNLATGYLYFVYKILHAVKLAAELQAAHPQYQFVPVYYMGSEDNDLDELGTFRYDDRKFTWDAAGQTGAVGRMQTASLRPLLEELFRLLGPPGPNLDVLKELLAKAYLEHDTIARATQYLVHELFGRYGLVVLDPDTPVLKRSFIPVMADDLLHHTAHNLVHRSISELEAAHYKGQAHPRMINLFYLKGDLRERIERQDGEWRVLHTDIRWDREALLAELQEHPERFSPNVILRGMYQETILPDVAFIGGGSEVAYWLQLQRLFDHYDVFYPSVQLRQSVLWVPGKEAALLDRLLLSVSDLFYPDETLIRWFVNRHTDDSWTTESETAAFEQMLQELKGKATTIDPTLRASAEAALTKIRYQLQVLEKKMLRAEKRKLQTQLGQLTRLKAALFPNGSLQERTENFLPFFLRHGFTFFDTLLTGMVPLEPRFMVVTE